MKAQLSATARFARKQSTWNLISVVIKLFLLVEIILNVIELPAHALQDALAIHPVRNILLLVGLLAVTSSLDSNPFSNRHECRCECDD